jgi:hypothetical protein
MPAWLSTHRHRLAVVGGLLLLALAALAFVWASSLQTTVLRTISCPVYQPPVTPDPAWPTGCGGQQVVAATYGDLNLAAFASCVLLVILGLASLRYGLSERPLRT